MPEPTVVMLPGMGADARVYKKLRREFGQLVVPEWLPPRRGETLVAYAKRTAGSLPERPMVVGGMSFGGMVAIEMARVLPGVDCVLIGSVTGPEHLPLRVRAAVAIGRVVPVTGFALGQKLARALRALAGRLLSPNSRALLDQFASADPVFLRWAILALASWRPTTESGPLRVHQLHGSRDQVLPASCAAGSEVVPGGGHVLTLTHPEEVASFLRSIVAPS